MIIDCNLINCKVVYKFRIIFDLALLAHLAHLPHPSRGKDCKKKKKIYYIVITYIKTNPRPPPQNSLPFFETLY